MLVRSLLALESTVIAHGLPFPHNVEIAREMQTVARAHGAEPRVIAVLKGEIKVGLTDEELQHLAQASDVMKLARRDLAIALAGKHDGATTVSATMFLAKRAGISVFATGGIGGVHRFAAGGGGVGNAGAAAPASSGAGTSSDVSADLLELASTPVAVVCAGAKAILDLAATVEFLETHGVPVLGYQTDDFPAFYSRQSGLPVQARVDSPEDAARIIRAHWSLGNSSGVLVCVPIPAGDEIPRQVIEPYIERALREARDRGIRGNRLTPFLLQQLAEMTHEASVAANKALLRQNAAVAADIAVALTRLDMPTV